MKYKDAIELYNVLNGLNPQKDSNLEYSAIKTLRALKPILESYAEKLEDITNDNVATTVKDGVQIRLLEKTITKDGQEINNPVFTKEGAKELTIKKRELDNSEAPPFKIHTTSDVIVLSPYLKETLTELGFIEQAK